MTVTLTPELKQFIAGELKSGHCHSVDDVVAQGLWMLRAREEFIHSNKAALREKIAPGMDQIRRGEVVDGKKAIQNLRKKLHQRERGGR